MPITFSCPCGQSYTVVDLMSGMRTRCEACKAVLVVPAVTAEDDEPVTDFDAEEESTTAAYGFAGESVPEPAPGLDDEPELVDDDEEVVDEVEQDESSPVYLVAASKSKTFRLYPDRDEVLVLHAGPGTAAGKALAREGLAKRAAVLDRMALGELRAEAGSDPNSFRITADNTSNVRIEPPASGAGADGREKRVVGRLTFTHATAGKCELMLRTLADARLAMKAFRRALGEENVAVTLKLKL
jgi:hypothetical protein